MSKRWLLSFSIEARLDSQLCVGYYHRNGKGYVFITYRALRRLPAPNSNIVVEELIKSASTACFTEKAGFAKFVAAFQGLRLFLHCSYGHSIAFTFA